MAITLLGYDAAVSSGTRTCYVFSILYSGGSDGWNMLECKLVVPAFAQNCACYSLRQSLQNACKVVLSRAACLTEAKTH